MKTLLSQKLLNLVSEIEALEGTIEELEAMNEKLKEDYERAEARIGQLEKELEDAYKPL